MTASPVRVPPEFARRVRQARAERGWSLVRTAREAGISTSAVWGAENGRDVYLSSAVAVARALGVSLGGMTGGDGEDAATREATHVTTETDQENR